MKFYSRNVSPGFLTALGQWDANKPFRDYHLFIDWRRIMIELGALAAGAVLLWRYRFPFMVMPIAVTLWYMSMDLVPFLFGDWMDWEIRKWVSLWFGLATVLFAFWVDLRSRAMINVAMVLIGAVLGRRVFAVFGGLGIAGYLGYLSAGASAGQGSPLTGFMSLTRHRFLGYLAVT